MKREMSVNGSFYPASCKEIEEMIVYFNLKLDKVLKEGSFSVLKPKALIVPHAGYIYSGFTANIAYRMLENFNYDRVIVIGPSHKVYINGISGSFFDSYETPCGKLEIDQIYLSELSQKFDIKFVQNAHREHSTEVQMPFLKRYFPDIKVIELVYGDLSYGDLSKIVEFLLKNDSNLVIISTDLSHFYNQEKAHALDSQCIKAIDELDVDMLESGECEACGKIGVAALTSAAKKLNLKSKILDYRTSGDITADKSSVVGYMSSVVY